MNQCCACTKTISDAETYEYRGALSCADCFDAVIESRDFQRNAIMREENAKLKPLKGLDLSDSIIGKANRKLLGASIEIASKESARLREYEGRQFISTTGPAHVRGDTVFVPLEKIGDVLIHKIELFKENQKMLKKLICKWFNHDTKNAPIGIKVWGAGDGVGRPPTYEVQTCRRCGEEIRLRKQKSKRSE